MKKEKKKMVRQKRQTSAVIFDVISIVAEKNANDLCRGFLYEPEIPRKLNNKIKEENKDEKF